MKLSMFYVVIVVTVYLYVQHECYNAHHRQTEVIQLQQDLLSSCVEQLAVQELFSRCTDVAE
jgi:hypothetical protein